MRHFTQPRLRFACAIPFPLRRDLPDVSAGGEPHRVDPSEPSPSCPLALAAARNDPDTRRAAGGRCQRAAASMKVALVHDWLVTYAGAERVLSELIRVFPEADLFS